jgi:hypothetical protein
MGQNTREAWQKAQKKARTNWGELVVEALAERCVFSGVTVGDELNEDAAAREIVRRNRLVLQIGDLAREMFTTSIGYMIVGRDASGKAVITAESPDYVYAAVDPLVPWQARAAVKVWRDVDQGWDFAYVWVPGNRAKYARPIADSDGRPMTQASGGWKKLTEEAYTGSVPVYVFENHGGTGEFETHTDLLDRINTGLLQRIVTVAMQAFKQRWVKGGLPQQDANGNDIDYAKMFEPAPGAMWDLPEGIDIGESQDAAQGILAMLQASKDDIRDFAAATRTPISTLLPDASNQSAEGAAFAREGLVFKARDRIERLKVGLNEVIAAALRVETPGFDDTVEVSFAPAENVSQTEKTAAAVSAKAADVPWRTRMTEIMGYSADTVDRMELELAQEALIGGLNGSANSGSGGGGAAVVRPADGGSPNPDANPAQAGVA